MKSEWCVHYENNHFARTNSFVYRTTSDVWKVKSKRLRCPVCGRSVRSSVQTCHDGCCVFHVLVRHKMPSKQIRKPMRKQKRISRRKR